jgi:hypothetical protein
MEWTSFCFGLSLVRWYVLRVVPAGGERVMEVLGAICRSWTTGPHRGAPRGCGPVSNQNRLETRVKHNM